jgi:hypothetical protein
MSCIPNVLYFPLTFIGMLRTRTPTTDTDYDNRFHFRMTALRFSYQLFLGSWIVAMLFICVWDLRNRVPAFFRKVYRIHDHAIIVVSLITFLIMIVDVELRLITRTYSDDNQGEVSQSPGRWTLSQVMAMVILIVPIWEIAKYYGEKNEFIVHWRNTWLTGSCKCSCGHGFVEETEKIFEDDKEVGGLSGRKL